MLWFTIYTPTWWRYQEVVLQFRVMFDLRSYQYQAILGHHYKYVWTVSKHRWPVLKYWPCIPFVDEWWSVMGNNSTMATEKDQFQQVYRLQCGCSSQLSLSKGQATEIQLSKGQASTEMAMAQWLTHHFPSADHCFRRKPWTFDHFASHESLVEHLPICSSLHPGQDGWGEQDTQRCCIIPASSRRILSIDRDEIRNSS